MAFSKTDQKRITTLAVMKIAINLGAEDLESAYNDAAEFVTTLEEDGLFDGGGGSGNSRSSGRSKRSGGRGSGSKSSKRGGKGGGSYDGKMKDPDGDPTEKQVNAVLNYTDDYNEDDLWDMTKKEVSDLIDDLGIFDN